MSFDSLSLNLEIIFKVIYLLIIVLVLLIFTTLKFSFIKIFAIAVCFYIFLNSPEKSKKTIYGNQSKNRKH